MCLYKFRQETKINDIIKNNINQLKYEMFSKKEILGKANSMFEL